MTFSITQANVSFDQTPTTTTYEMERGATPDYPVMAVYERPIRPKLSKLLKSGFKEDRSSYNILSINQFIINRANVSFEQPQGVFGVWGAAQRFDKSKLDGAIVFSYDNFETISRTAPLDIEFKASAGVPQEVMQGVDDTKAGTGVRSNSVRIQPATGLPYQETGLAGGYFERNVQMGRLTITVKNAKGEPVSGDTVRYEATGDFYTTDESGKIIFDAPSATLTFTALRGSKTKSVTINAFEEKELVFQYGGIEGVAVDANNNPIPGTVVDVQEVNGDDHFIVYTNGDGKFLLDILKPESVYKITILNYWKQVYMMGEGILVPVNFNNASGWNVPEGYPTTPQNAAIIVKDERGRPLYGVIVEMYDEKLTFSVKTNLNGNAVLVVPAKKWYLRVDPEGRYYKVEKEVDLSTAPYSETIILTSKPAISIR